MKLAKFRRDYGEFTERYGHLLDHPIFTVSRLQDIEKSITYRQLNAWERKGLILSSREKLDTGWRKFSVIDCAKIKIIFDLRKIGCSRERVRSFTGKWDGGKIGLWSPRENRVLRLTHLGLKDFVMACLFGVRVFLVIRENGETFFLSETGAKSFYLHSNNEFSPIITLPFFSYVEKTSGIMKKRMEVDINSTVEELFETMLPYQEGRISRWIRSRNYKEIVFEKSEGEKTTIKATQKKNVKLSTKDILKAIDSGDYYSIVITTRREQKITILRKDWMARIKT